MAARPDDDVPDAPSGSAKAADGVERDDAGDTTAALRKPASPAKAPVAADDATGEDARTVRRVVDTKQLRADRSRLAPPTPQLGGVQPRDAKPPAIRMTSKKATAQGLGVPQPLSRRTASIPPPPPPPPKATEADEPDDSSITAAAPPPAQTGASIVPSTASLGPVKITQLGDDEGEGDETEVRTVVAAFAGIEPSPRPSPSPAAGRPPPAPPPPPDEGAEAIDDSVTTQAPALASPADDEPQTQPPILSPAAMPSPGAARPPAKSVDMYETDESVTSRGPAVAEYDDDDSITAEGPAVARPGKPVPALPSSSARPGGPVRLLEEEDDDDEDGDDHPNNHTAVMINAPVKPPSPKPLFTTAPMTASPPAGRALATGGEPLSDSGLRIAPAVRPEAAGDHASVGVLLAGVPPSQRFSDPDGANPYAPTAPAFAPLDSLAAHPSGELGLARKPNYGLIVGVVAGMSIVIPLVLYVSLRSSGPAPEPRTPSEVEPDLVGTADTPRPRAPSTKPSSTTTRPPWWKKR